MLFIKREILDVDVTHALIDDMCSPCLVTIVTYFDICCETRRSFQAETIVSAVEKEGGEFKALKLLRTQGNFISYLFVEGRT